MRILRSCLIPILTISVMIIAAGCGSSSDKEKLEKIRNSMTADEDPLQNKGIGPVKSLELGAVDQQLAVEGEELFNALCTACHKVDKKFIGPSPRGIMERRSPEWIMNMILNPEEMTRKDPIARQLLIEANGAPMANQNLTEDDARKILEYFRTL